MAHLLGKERIAFNTIISYGQTLLSVFLLLFSSRWALGYLGIDDFGIFNLIVSILTIVVFLNAILSNGDARFFAYGIGQKNQNDLNKVFNVSLSLHLLIPILIVVIGLVIGEYVLVHFLVIPPYRLNSSVFAFRITMLASYITMASVPFSTLFVAHQDILVHSIILLFRTFLLFVGAYLLRFSFGGADKLVLYTVFVSVAHIVTSLTQILISRKMYNCTKVMFCYFFDKQLSLSLLEYSFWTMIGHFGYLVRTQGLSIIVNLYFGTAGNAALGIANQVSAQASKLTNSLSSSVSPEIYRRVGEGNMKSATSISIYSSKIGVFLMLIIGIPILLNLYDLLEVWLVNVPSGAYTLCVCFIFMFIIEKVTSGQLDYLRAINKIALVNILIFITYSLPVIFVICGLKSYGFLGIGLSCVLSMLLTIMSIMYCTYKYSSASLKSLVSAIIPLFFIILIVFVFSECVHMQSNNIIELLLNCVVAFVFSGILTIFMLFNKYERSRLFSIMNVRCIKL